MATPNEQDVSARYRSAFLDILGHGFSSLKQSLELFLGVARQTLEVARASVWVFEPGEQCLRLVHLIDAIPERISPLSELRADDFQDYFDALRQFLVVAADDAERDPRTACLHRTYSAPLGIAAYLDTPVRSFGQPIGVLCLEHVGGPRVWTQQDQNFAAAVATQISLAFERDHLRDAETQLVRRTFFDPMTNLANGMLLRDRLNLSFGEGDNQRVSLWWLDVEQFRALTFSIGTPLSEQLIAAIAERLRPLVPTDGLLARAALDEFGVLLLGASAEQVEATNDALTRAMDEPLTVGTRKLRVTLAIGLSEREVGEGHRETELLIQEAKSASRSARNSGRVHVFMSQDLEGRRREGELEQELRQALDEGEFEPFFQPIVDLQAQRVIGFESLIRWRRQGKIVLPAEFLTATIQHGLLPRLGRQMISRAIQCFADSISRLDSDLVLHINLSAMEILAPGTVDFLARQLKAARVDPHRLTVEITETVMIEDLASTSQVISQLRGIGIEVVLDDFGTGFASLSCLRELRFDAIKIDRSFIADLEHSLPSRAMLEAVTHMATRLGCSVIAEGIERPGHADQIARFDLSKAQGYWFGHPEPVQYWLDGHFDQLVARLRAHEQMFA